MRLSLIFPPHSLITRVSSWTIPVRSLPIARNGQVLLHLCVDGGNPRCRAECTGSGGGLRAGTPAAPALA